MASSSLEEAGDYSATTAESTSHTHSTPAITSTVATIFTVYSNHIHSRIVLCIFTIYIYPETHFEYSSVYEIAILSDTAIVTLDCSYCAMGGAHP